MRRLLGPSWLLNLLLLLNLLRFLHDYKPAANFTTGNNRLFNLRLRPLRDNWPLSNSMLYASTLYNRMFDNRALSDRTFSDRTLNYRTFNYRIRYNSLFSN